jgi:2,5-diketo-D-gluconate reductase A
VRASKGGRAAVFPETKVWISDYGYDETLHAFDKSAGKPGVNRIGHLTSLLEAAEVVPSVNQIELHPYFQQPEVQAFDAEHGGVTQAWSPIGGITFYRDSGHTSTLEDPAIVTIAESVRRRSA